MSDSNNLFLSQPISHRTGSHPLLLPSNNNNRSNAKTILSSHNNNNHDDARTFQSSKTTSWGWNIQASTIPSLPMYYMLEQTSVTLRDTPVLQLENRLAEFLRIQSISYTVDATSCRFDCVTSNMLKFVVQFWRVQGDVDPNQAVTLELQRRQGSVLEMQSIRRKLWKAVLTGEQQQSIDDDQINNKPLPDAIMAEVDANYDHDAGRADALDICLRLLESPCCDQIRLGLESLRMLTQPTIVSWQDAMVVSRAVCFGEGEGHFGARLQTALASHFRIAAAADQCMALDYEYTKDHNMGLAVLASALQMVAQDTDAPGDMDFAGAFWEPVIGDLYYNVQRAVEKPNEAAISARCIRLIGAVKKTSTTTSELILSSPSKAAGLRSCLTQAHRHGQRFHLLLEKESQKLLVDWTV